MLVWLSLVVGVFQLAERDDVKPENKESVRPTHSR